MRLEEKPRANQTLTKSKIHVIGAEKRLVSEFFKYLEKTFTSERESKRNLKEKHIISNIFILV